MNTEEARAKAKELVHKMFRVENPAIIEHYEELCIEGMKKAKGYAMAMAEQIQETYTTYVKDGRIEPISNPTLFEDYEQVKQEIESL